MGRLSDNSGFNPAAEIGEVRTYTGTWKDSGATKTASVRRTNRPYVQDLCDAYNASLSERAKREKLRWFVSKTGGLEFGKPAQLIETEAAERWKARNSR